MLSSSVAPEKYASRIGGQVGTKSIVERTVERYNDHTEAQEVIDQDENKWKNILQKIDTKGDGMVDQKDFTGAINEFIEGAYDQKG